MDDCINGGLVASKVFIDLTDVADALLVQAHSNCRFAFCGIGGSLKSDRTAVAEIVQHHKTMHLAAVRGKCDCR